MFWKRCYHFKQTTEVEKSKEKKGFQNVKVTILWIQPSWFKFDFESMLSIEGESTLRRGQKCCHVVLFSKGVHA
jgi:hypothetical protein